ncbi:phage baseplate assembly protein V [compost metagenome]
MQVTSRLLGPIRRRLAHLVARAVVTLVNDAAKMQALQLSLLADEPLDGAEHWQPYGFTYKPHPGAEALVLAVGGHRAHSVVIACADRRYRVTALEDGEVAIYTDEQDKIHFKRGKVIEIETNTFNVNAATSVNFDTPLMTLTGELQAQVDVKAGPISLIGHTHSGTGEPQ